MHHCKSPNAKRADELSWNKDRVSRGLAQLSRQVLSTWLLAGQALEALSADDDSLVHHRKGPKSKRADELPWNKDRVSKKRQREQESMSGSLGSLDLEPIESMSRSGDSQDGMSSRVSNRGTATLQAPECVCLPAVTHCPAVRQPWSCPALHWPLQLSKSRSGHSSNRLFRVPAVQRSEAGDAGPAGRYTPIC